MIKRLLKSLWKVDGMEFSDNPSGTKGVFNLYYGKLLIGNLMYDGENWSYNYSDEYKAFSKIIPVIDFPDLNKVYSSKDLWPFFATRIPTINQPYHLKKIKKANIQEDDSVELLKLFGKETITNPYKLTPA
jgi:HipA-like protein